MFEWFKTFQDSFDSVQIYLDDLKIVWLFPDGFKTVWKFSELIFIYFYNYGRFHNFISEESAPHAAPQKFLRKGSIYLNKFGFLRLLLTC